MQFRQNYHPFEMGFDCFRIGRNGESDASWVTLLRQGSPFSTALLIHWPE